MEKRALIAFALSMAVFILWSLLFGASNKSVDKTPDSKPTSEIAAKADEDKTAPVPEVVATPATEPAATPVEQVAPAVQEAPPSPQVPARDITVDTPLFTAVLTEQGGRLKSLSLKKYRETMDKNSPAKELVHVAGPEDYPLGLSFMQNRALNLEKVTFQTAGDQKVSVAPGQNAEVSMTYTSADGLTIVRNYRFNGDSYLIGMDVTVRNLSRNTVDDNLVLNLDSAPITKKERYAGFAAYMDKDLKEVKPKDLEDKSKDWKDENYNLSWAGYMDQYFLAALIPQDAEKTRLSAEAYGKAGVKVSFINPPINMPPQTEKTYQFNIYYGPKQFQILKSTGHELERSIYFGWFDILSKPLLIVMNWLHGFVGNYGLVIILVTIIIKILFWPLTAKSYKSMKAMQKLQPKIMKLREKFKDDRQAMNQEMMQLYRTYKVNPMGGCLPMVIQIPVFIALYRLLDYSLELRHAPFWLWIQDLSAPDRLLQFDFTVPMLEPPTGIPVLTLLMGASMLLQQKMTPTPGDPTQAKIMMLMPIFFTFIFINFPSGLVLYWLVNNILSLGQQYMINKRPS